jgi:reactive intermediate/imine deaminase
MRYLQVTTRHWKAVEPEGLAAPLAPASYVAISGSLVFLAGHMPLDEEGRLVGEGFSTQAHRVFENIGTTLKSVGCGFGDVIKVNAYLSDLSYFDEYNTIYREYFHTPFPARTTVQAVLYGFLIEVDAIAISRETTRSR